VADNQSGFSRSQSNPKPGAAANEPRNAARPEPSEPQRRSAAEEHAANRPDLKHDFSRIDTPLWDLNQAVRDLLKMLRRNQQESRFGDLKKSDQKALMFCDELVDLFLWKVCLHETQEVELAATAITETRRELFALLDESVNGSLLRQLISRGTLWSQRPNVWLYLQVQKKLNELRTAFGPLLASARRHHLAPPTHLLPGPDSIRAQLRTTCALKQLQRKPHPDRHGNVRQAPDWNPEKFCWRACDLLLLFELALRLCEMSKVLGLSTATVHKKLIDYSEKLKRNEAKLAELAGGKRTATNAG
jgi:hypothetical protein